MSPLPFLSRIRFRDAGTLLGLALIGTVFAFQTDSFLTLPNIVNILQQSSINACIALGMTLVIISGGIDLSVGPVAAFVGGAGRGADGGGGAGVACRRGGTGGGGWPAALSTVR